MKVERRCRTAAMARAETAARSPVDHRCFGSGSKVLSGRHLWGRFTLIHRCVIGVFSLGCAHNSLLVMRADRHGAGVGPFENKWPWPRLAEAPFITDNPAIRAMPLD
jgi:hypothetical protein